VTQNIHPGFVARTGTYLDELDERVPGLALAVRATLESRERTRRQYGAYSATGPTLGDALAMIDEWSWHPWHEDAAHAIEVARISYGGIEAMARATELAEAFEAMTAPWPRVA
jgi:hypothetical protein